MTKVKPGKVTALVGAQLGSEGKGVVANRIANDYQVSVRTGGPNAGHSFVHDGELYKMQSLPCGWTNPEQTLVIGAGAVVSPKLLLRELSMVRAVCPDIDERVIVDAAATVLDKHHQEEEGGTKGELHARMGSTGEGVGAARRGRMLRDPNNFRLACSVKELDKYVVENTANILSNSLRGGKNVLLEGTQGCGLSLTHGAWPHVTTGDTNSAQLAADAGVPPHMVDEVILVARTFPIRVAGPSGPLHQELSWDEMSEIVGCPVVEHTTVTKKKRRIGRWDDNLMHNAVVINKPHHVALTFLDYYSPEDRGVTQFEELSEKALDFIHYVERTYSTYVRWIGTGWDEKSGWVFVER